MKTCSYCGAEYADDAVMCTLDQTPLKSNIPAAVPAPAPPAVPIEIPPRPNLVKLAIACLAGSFVVSLLQTLAVYGLRHAVVPVACEFVFALFLVCMIYECRNWVRWLIVGITVIWLASVAFHFQVVTNATVVRGLLLGVQSILWMAVLFMLFTPSANKWFRTQSKPA